MFRMVRLNKPRTTRRCEDHVFHCVRAHQCSAEAKPEIGLEVIVMPENCTDPAYVKSLNDKPGILALAMKQTVDPKTKQPALEAIPFVVPGARFNEKYGWDSVSVATLLRIGLRIVSISSLSACLSMVGSTWS